MAKRELSVYDRFVQKIEVNPISGCWEWRGAINNCGYGVFGAVFNGEKISKAHRFSFCAFYGYLPGNGRHVDHKCNVRHCVNPDHLQDITHQENLKLRSANQTHCKRGHLFNEANTIKTPLGRACRPCVAIRRERRKAERLNRSAFDVSLRNQPYQTHSLCFSSLEN